MIMLGSIALALLTDDSDVGPLGFDLCNSLISSNSFHKVKKSSFYLSTVTRGESGLISGDFLCFLLRFITYLIVRDFLFSAVGKHASTKPPLYTK